MAPDTFADIMSGLDNALIVVITTEGHERGGCLVGSHALPHDLVMPGPFDEDVLAADPDGQETVLAQHVVGGRVLDPGDRLGAVQAELGDH